MKEPTYEFKKLPLHEKDYGNYNSRKKINEQAGDKLGRYDDDEKKGAFSEKRDEYIQKAIDEVFSNDLRNKESKIKSLMNYKPRNPEDFSSDFYHVRELVGAVYGSLVKEHAKGVNVMGDKWHEIVSGVHAEYPEEIIKKMIVNRLLMQSRELSFSPEAIKALETYNE